MNWLDSILKVLASAPTAANLTLQLADARTTIANLQAQIAELQKRNDECRQALETRQRRLSQRPSRVISDYDPFDPDRI